MPWKPRRVDEGGLNWSDFTAPELVDLTAVPSEDFLESLQLSLLPNFNPFLIEFWINANGKTERIICVEGDCSDELQPRLEQLLETTFKPAIKDGVAIASRKLIQIDPVYIQ